MKIILKYKQKVNKKLTDFLVFVGEGRVSVFFPFCTYMWWKIWRKIFCTIEAKFFFTIVITEAT